MEFEFALACNCVTNFKGCSFNLIVRRSIGIQQFHELRILEMQVADSSFSGRVLWNLLLYL